ncbi:hypothetical protein ABTY59_32180 [Streptomyces sp. NPDC096079]|uniref:hypothetical protein n=1 Tax=Streptomyces sp. NPDC096079 TaxID=3155820 RepID=UPI003317A966
MITTEPNPYWGIVTGRAEEVWEAHCTPDADITSGMRVYLRHAEEFGLLQATHIAQICLLAVVHDDAPPATRRPDGTVDIDRLVPAADADAHTRNEAAEYLVTMVGLGFSQALEAAEQQIAASAQVRATIQTILDGALHGLPGRERALNALWDLRDDERALCGVLALTGAALQAVRQP